MEGWCWGGVIVTGPVGTLGTVTGESPRWNLCSLTIFQQKFESKAT